MPAKEISASELKVTTAASNTLKKSLVNNQDYDGSPRGVPAGVQGEASLTSVKVLKSDKPTECWIIVNAVGTVTSPEEFRGRLVYPGYIYGKSTLSDPEKVDDTVKGLIRFMRNIGVPQAQIDKAKAGKPEEFFYTAIKIIESCSGKNAARFKFTTRAQKKDASRTECLAGGPVDVETGDAPFAADSAPEKGSVPQEGEIWEHQEVVGRVIAVDATEGAETIDLEPLDGSEPITGIAWFSEDGQQQIKFIR